jgi:predicted helicase
MRKALVDEFSSLYVLNLRGNYRNGPSEGGSVFDITIGTAISILVKNPQHEGPGQIHYTSVGDSMSGTDKLALLSSTDSILSLELTSISPNKSGDWLNQRSDDYERFLPLFHRGTEERVFVGATDGVKTNRDAWVYGSTPAAVLDQVTQMANCYNKQIGESSVTEDPKQISWSTGLRKRLKERKPIVVDKNAIRRSTYRPFVPKFLYFDGALVEAPSRVPDFFPTPAASTIGFYALGVGATANFSLLMIDSTPDVQAMGAGQNGTFFGRYRYEPTGAAGGGQGTFSFDEGEVIDGFRRIDNITDQALAKFKAAYPSESISKDDVFFYVYGVLHSRDYRDTFAADLRKMLPRIPFLKDFRSFTDAGRALSALHLNYGSVERYPLAGLEVEPLPTVDAYEFFSVEKPRFAGSGKKKDTSQLNFNRHITLSAIPEAVHRYMLGPRSAIEWLNDRYSVRADPKSGITSDPNESSREAGNPRYILDLYARVVTVSVETMKLVDGLPPLEEL